MESKEVNSPSYRKSVLNVHWKDRCWSWSSNMSAIWYKQLTHWKRPWCWERLRAEGEGGDRCSDGWMVSLTQWTWVWANSRRWWWTGKSGELQSTIPQKSQTQLNDWTATIQFLRVTPAPPAPPAWSPPSTADPSWTAGRQEGSGLPSTLLHAVFKVNFLIRRILCNKELENNGYLQKKNFERVACIWISIWHLEQDPLGKWVVWLLSKRRTCIIWRGFLVRFTGVGLVVHLRGSELAGSGVDWHFKWWRLIQLWQQIHP